MAHENLGILCDAQSVSADDTVSDYYIDLAVTKPQIGVGQHAPWLCIKTNTAPTDSGDTLSIEVQNDADDAFSDPTVVFMPLVGANGAEVAATDARLATAGAWIFRGQLPYEIDERYLRLMFRNTTSNGAFTIDAWLEDGPPSDFGVQVLTSPVGNP